MHRGSCAWSCERYGGLSRLSVSWRGMERGTARLGTARQGSARHGRERGKAWLGMARQGVAWPGVARHGTRHGRAGLGAAGQGLAGQGREHGSARQGMAWLGKAGQGKAGQGKGQASHRRADGFSAQTDNRKAGSMKARQFQVTMTGQTPLLMHYDNLDWAGMLEKWGREPSNKKISVPGDDRTPPWRWIGNLYLNAGHVCIPSDNLMTMLREGGAKCPTGKKGGTFKRQTQSGLVVDQVAWNLVSSKGEIKMADIKPLTEEMDFEAHIKAAEKLGFMLFVKRAKIGQAKHVRVRPRFDVWSCSGTITTLDETINRDVLQMILDNAGMYCGIGDWRPSSPKSPGSFGKFTATVK